VLSTQTPASTDLARLSEATIPPGVRGHNRSALGTGIVHIGLGIFHRAHLAVYTAKAINADGGDWGIFASSRRDETPSAMRDQELLYSVVDIAPGTEAITVPAVHTAVLGRGDPSALVVAEIGKAGTKIVTLTITEAGYTFSPGTHQLDLDSALVQGDLAGATSPATAIGQIVRGLQLRMQTHGTPVTVLSCDNLADNGDLTADLVRHFAELLPDDESAALLEYIASSVTFPNSMVDRIVLDTDDRHRAMAAARLGVRDTIPVPAEPFTMWVLQDRFAAGRPRWEVGGAIFTDDVTPYDVLKLRLLNGTHSLLAYLGALDGQATIPDARFQGFIEQAANTLLRQEYLPTLTVPAEINADEYINHLFSRWSNSVLADPTSRVGSNGSGKLPQRITEPVQHHIARGVMPEHICLTVAGFLACLAPLDGYEPGPFARAMVDPAKDRLAALSAECSTAKELVWAVFSRGDVFAPVLAEQLGFVDRVGEYLELIMRSGVRTAAAEAARASLNTDPAAHRAAGASTKRT
jgi:fructuronate reductase